MRKPLSVWARIRREEGCWPWQGPVDKNGYGFQGARRVHRIVWAEKRGPIPVGMCICHRCDNPRCCRPSHLFMGTVADNNADRDRKGRSYYRADGLRSYPRPKGSAHPLAKLTERDVESIRGLLLGPLTQRAIGERFGVTQTTVSEIARGRKWGHVPGASDSPRRRRMPTGDAHWMRREPERVLRGRAHPNAKLTPAAVRNIRRLYAAGDSQAAIAARFGIEQTTVSRIVLKTAWAHVA